MTANQEVPMRPFAFLALLAAMTAFAGAANICVWNYDTLDRFFDPALAESVDCATNVASGLEALGHSVEVFDRYLPSDISGYDVVFCLMGWYRC
jgi:hypothetical protein